MADHSENNDIQLHEKTDENDEGIIWQSSLPTEDSTDLAVEQSKPSEGEFCHQAFEGESLVAESDVGVVKQTDSQIQQELCPRSPQGDGSEVNGKAMPCVIATTLDAGSNLDARNPSEFRATEKGDALVSSPTFTDNQEMELSVSAQLEILSFGRLQNMSQNPEDEPGQQSDRCSDLPQVDAAAEVQDSEGDSSSSEDTSSESDSDSTSSSSSSLLLAIISEAEDDDQEPGEKKKPHPIKTKDELMLEDLPNVEEVNIVLPEEVQKEPIGVVCSIIDQLVIVESRENMPPVNEETILFRKNRSSIGQVFEVFGPVCHPFYVLRFNSPEDICAKGIELQELLFFAPAVKDFTQYIFAERLKDKGSDASWRNDQEPPNEALDFSDDDKEKEAKQRKKKKPQNHGDKNTRAGGKEDGQVSQQARVKSIRGRGFHHNPGRGFDPYSSARFENPANYGFPQPSGSYNPPFNQRPPGAPPSLHPANSTMHSQPAMHNPMMSYQYSPSFWPPMCNDLPPFLSPPPPPPPPPPHIPPPPPSFPPHPISWPESNVRHPPCFPNSSFSCYPNASPSRMPNSQFSPRLPPQGQPDYRPPY
ncbi:H/ACA ribonucleoprotein complex non-core subunit NAF1 [Amblyraja radiata]|uniref:H/ACA ribonucleoprotein complex non-core subunit NAF1 n=1 Tax=Amblyraja radiata TaxID=386614 RepID=UPI001404249C|nr:H/ACA ribonucleoprotein complex non-core subunit NAF1 [Amblyraja radiata]